MKNKKGFTLIELLAVIVILAIIALIVTPVVSNIVANARIAANARSVEGHIRNIELAIITKAFGEESTGDLDTFDTITSGATIESSLSRPGNDNVTCKKYNISHGTVINASGCRDKESKWGKKYSYTKEDGAYATGNLTVEFEGKILSNYNYETHKGIVYMDPTDISNTCIGHNDDIDVTSRTVKEGCMKFYIYDDSGSTYKMILDRNLGENVTIADAATVLASQTEDWIGSPRLITADEIAHILGIDTSYGVRWSSSKSYVSSVNNSNTQSSWFYFDVRDKNRYVNGLQSSDYRCKTSSESNYLWLFDYTKNCINSGCGNNFESTNGYWTSTPVTDNDGYYWSVINVAALSIRIDSTDNIGIRPVIEVSKSLLTSEVEDSNTFGGIKTEALDGETHKGIVYIDPTNIKNECDSSYNLNITKRNTKEGCMKFYIYDDSGDSYKMILNENLGSSVFVSKNDYIAKAISSGLTEEDANTNWNNQEYNTYGLITVNKYLSEKTVNWLGEVRLISADEIAHIVGADREDAIKWSSSKEYKTPINYDSDIDINTQISGFYLDGARNGKLTGYPNGWHKLYPNSSTRSNYAWLYDFTGSCIQYGCNYEKIYSEVSHPYATGSIVGNNSVCILTNESELSCSHGPYSSYGIRPVLIIPKSLIG